MAEGLAGTQDEGDALAARLSGMGVRSGIFHLDAFREARRDAFQNLTTGVGTLARDKRLGAVSYVDPLSYQQCAQLYRSNDIAARIADDLPTEMCRKGWELAIQGGGGRETSEAVSAVLDTLESRKHIRQSLRWSRAFGGSGLFVGANDGQTAEKPLDMKAIRSVDFLLPLDTLELVANTYYQDPLHPKYGLPETYRLNRFGTVSPLPNIGGTPNLGALSALQGGISLLVGSASNWSVLPIVHESRLIRFEGAFINRLTLRQNRWWPDSVFVRCNAVIRDFNLSWDSAAVLLQDFAQAVIKIKGLGALLAKNGPTAFQDAAAMIDMSRSSARALVLDAEDEFMRSATPLTGLPDLLDRFALRLAAAANMPVTRLMGQAPAGLNATGDQDAAWWSEYVEGCREDQLRPALNRLCTILFSAKEGPTNGKDPGAGNWKIVFPPLRQLDDLQQAQRRLAIAQADAVLVKEGIVTPEEVAVTRYGGDEYNGDKLHLTEADPQKRAMVSQENAEAEAAAKGEAEAEKAAKLGAKKGEGDEPPPPAGNEPPEPEPGAEKKGRNRDPGNEGGAL